MDEPLSNLDAKLRVQLRNELKKMQKDFGITTIYVTHDQEEALTLSDRIAVFNKRRHRAGRHARTRSITTAQLNLSATSSAISTASDEGIVNELINMGAPVDPAKHNYIRLERVHVNVQPRERRRLRLTARSRALNTTGCTSSITSTVCGQTHQGH